MGLESGQGGGGGDFNESKKLKEDFKGDKEDNCKGELVGERWENKTFGILDKRLNNNLDCCFFF